MKRRSHHSPAGLTGYEAVEFLDIPPMSESVHGAPALGRVLARSYRRDDEPDTLTASETR